MFYNLEQTYGSKNCSVVKVVHRGPHIDWFRLSVSTMRPTHQMKFQMKGWWEVHIVTVSFVVQIISSTESILGDFNVNKMT